ARFAAPVGFASTLDLIAAPAGAQPMAAGGADPVWNSLQTPQVWIDAQAYEDGGTLHYPWYVALELFPAGLIDELFAAYRGLVERLAEDDASWTAPLPSLAPLVAERAVALLAAANDTAAPVPAGLLHEPFFARAERDPNAVAVVAADRTLTYGELAQASRRLAALLHEHHVAPGELVAIVMEKGWEQAVAVLAVLQAGAAYLPIDPAVPAERLAYLLDNGRARVALTQPALDADLVWPAGVERIGVDGTVVGAPVTLAPDAAPLRMATDLAYVLFTSGSTGRPKGVMIEHRGALNTVADVNERFAVAAADRVLALSALNFDLSVYDLFGPLAVGGAVVVPAPDALREPARWAEILRREKVTIWSSVPALLEMLVDHLEGRGESLPPSLRLVMLSGDWIPVGLPDRARALRPGLQVIAMGGATEASIWSILYPVGDVDPAWPSIPYGKAMANQSFHVLDGRLAPRPVWVPGQLYIGGVGLARGYFRDEEKTAAAFIVHPETGERLYRTGDLGRLLPDGNIEFLGREDLQVKVQGYRIELGEIEAALAEHPGVRSGVVAAVGRQRGSKRLVAYVVLVSQGAPDEAELRAFLAGKLPHYMVPASFVVLSALPLTANGKVDRGALPSGDAARHDSHGAFVPPRDELELVLARLFEEVLETAPVSVAASFFELGGHSLLAVRLMARIKAELGRDLPLSVLFEAATVEGLAALLRREGGTDDRRLLVGITTTGARPPLFFVHPVGGSVLCYADLARRLGPEQPFYGLQAPDAAARWTLEEMADAYLAELRAVQPQGPYRLGGWSMGGVVAYEMARRLVAAGERVERLALVDAAVPGTGGEPLDADDAVLASWFARDLGGLTGIDLEVSPDELRGLDASAQAELLLARAQAAHVLPRDLTTADLLAHLAVFLRNYAALLGYRPQPYAGELLLLNAAEGEGDLAAAWRQVAASVDALRVPGNHYTMVRPPCVEALAERLAAHLSGGGDDRPELPAER
ncbi:MAG TPA: amino acid adenylation domain-containing protein, partial [Thermoanaerobaculia bacterium]